MIVRKGVATLVAIAALSSFAAHTEDAPRAAPRTERYGGFELRDNLSLEVSPRSDAEALDLSDIADSASTPLDINSGWRTSTVKAVGALSLQELLSWQRDWRLLGAVGYHRSDIDRAAVTVGTRAGDAVSDDESGLLLGTGVLYTLGFVDLQGYVQWYGVFDDREAWDAGPAVRRRF